MLITHPQAAATGMLSSNEAGISPAALAALPPSLVAALREPTILIAAAEWTLARDLMAVPVTLLPLERDPEAGLIVHADGQRVPLPALPPICLAAIAFTDEGAADLEAAIAGAPGSEAAPHVTRMEPGDAMALAVAIVAGSTSLLRRQAGLLTDSLRSLGHLRVAHEDHQARLAALEAYVARDNRQDFDCVFAEPPVADTALRLGSDANIRRITQLLPVASRGVSAIAIHLAETPLTPDAVLDIRLTSIEDGQERAAWRIAAPRLSPGWQVLGLDRALIGLSRTLSLSVEVSGGTIALGLGARQPLPSFRVLDEEGAAPAPRSLAFKVWTGLPGVMPPLTEIDHLAGAEDLGPGFEQVSLPFASIELTRDGATLTRRALSDDSLPCDTARNGIALGRLAGALPAGTLLAQATGRATAPAGSIAFALAAAASPEAALALAEQVEPATFWSGWVAIDESGSAPLHLFVPADGAAPSDLYVLTRRTTPGEAAPVSARLTGLGATVAATRMATARPAPPEIPAEAPAELLVSARDFSGQGFHALEGEGDNAWRWLGADVKLRLQAVPRDARVIEVQIAATAPGLTEGSLGCSVNGAPSEAHFVGSLEEGLVARIPIPAVAHRRDRVLVLDLAFGRAHKPAGDSRMLSVACTGLRISA